MHTQNNVLGETCHAFEALQIDPNLSLYQSDEGLINVFYIAGSKFYFAAYIQYVLFKFLRKQLFVFI